MIAKLSLLNIYVGQSASGDAKRIPKTIGNTRTSYFRLVPA